MTQFRVLPIRRGDAYLLQSPRGDYLVDGGAHGFDLPGLLEERRAKKLRAAICTSACEERIGGILNLLEAGFNVSEYWLPEEIERIIEGACRFNRDWHEWTSLVCKGPSPRKTEPHQALQDDYKSNANEQLRRLEGAAMLLSLALEALPDIPGRNIAKAAPFHCEKPNIAYLSLYFDKTLHILALRAAQHESAASSASEVIRQYGWQLFHGGEPGEMALLCGRLLLTVAEQLPGGTERGSRAIVKGLAIAAMAAATLSISRARTRSFRHTGRRESYLVPRHPMVCLNGIEVDDPLADLPTAASPQFIYTLARTISAHKGGLVFQYGDINCSALFCSDSRMMFLEGDDAIALDRPTVITAPRQGTSAAERTYGYIRSDTPDNDVWVRSHYSNARKVSVYFKKLPRKICLNNCRDLTLQEILLDFSDSRWNLLAGGRCVCG